jgi:hypothetical protein
MTDHATTRLWALCIMLAVLVFLREGLAPGVQVLGGHDVAGAFVPWWQLWREALAAGYLPLWDVTSFSGYPFFANSQVALFYPVAWLVQLLPLSAAPGWFVAFHMALAGVGMLLFTRSRGAGPHAAGLAGLAFTFSAFFVARIWSGHIGLIAVTAWAPWLLLATVKAQQAGTLRTAVLGALPWAAALLAGHVTSMAYLGMLWAGFVLLLLTEADDRPRLLRQVAIMGGLGTLLAAVQLVPLVELAGLSQRAAEMTFEQAVRWSLPPVQTVTLLLPEFFGEPTTLGYWGALSFEELTIYAGLLPALTAIAALGQPTRRTAFWLVLIGVGLWMALGSYGGLYAILWEVVPGFDLLRVPGRAGFFYVFAAPVLLADFLSRERTRAGWVALAVAALVIAGIAVGAVRGNWGGALLPASDPGQLVHRAAMLRRTLIVLALGAGALVAFHRVPTRYKPAPAALLAALLLFDLWGFGAKLIRTMPTAPDPYWQQAAAVIPEPPAEAGRVIPWGLPIFEQNGAAQVGLKSVFGYNPLEVTYVQRLAATGGDPRAASYDVLGVHYLLTGWPAEEFTTGERAVRTLNEGGGAVWVHERAVTLPLARHTPQVIAIPETEAALAALLAPGFDPARTAITAAPVGCDNPQTAALSMEVQRPGYWRMTVEAQGGPAYIVLAEADYPGWQAFINGERVEHQRVYTALKGVCVPPGTHTLEWRFRPVSLRVGAALSAVSLLVGSAVVAAAHKPPEALHQ